MKKSTAIVLGILGVAVVGGTVGTVVVVQKSNANAKAREQANALELARLENERAKNAAGALKTPTAPKPAAVNLGGIAKDLGGFLAGASGLVGNFRDLRKF